MTLAFAIHTQHPGRLCLRRPNMNAASGGFMQRLGAALDPAAQRQKGDETDLVYRHPWGTL